MNIEPMSQDEAETSLPESTDLSGVSDADLDAALEQIQEGEDAPDFDNVLSGEQVNEPAPEPEAEPVAAESAPQEPQELAPDAEGVNPPSPSADETPAEPALEANGETNGEAEKDEIDEIRSMLELSDLKSQKAATEADRWRFLADRNAGELAHIKSQLNTRESERAQGAVEQSSDPYDELPGVADQRTAVVPSDFREEMDELRSERVTRAIEQEGARFNDRNRDFMDYIQKQDEAERAEFTKDFNDLLAKNANEFGDALQGKDAKLASVTARTVYDSSLVDARIKMKERHLTKIRNGKQEEKAALVEQKRAAAPTTGQATQPPEAPTDKPLHLLSDKEFSERFRKTRFR